MVYIDASAVNPGILIMFISFATFVDSTVIIRRQLVDKEWKFLSHVAAHKPLLRKIGVAIGIGEDDVDDVARAAQRRRAYFHAGQ